MVLNAKSTELLSILSLEFKLEFIPEPWRMQKDLIVRIEYSVFRDFILNCMYTKDLMRIDIDVMRECLLKDDDTFNNHYYRQLCLAQLKELSYAQARDKYATTIVPYISNAPTAKLSERNRSGQLMIYEHGLTPTLKLLSDLGFPLTPLREGDKNYNLYVLALYYFEKSTNFDGIVTLENIVL